MRRKRLPLFEETKKTVFHRLDSCAAYEVEFSDRDGRTYQSLGLRPDQFMVLHYEPESDLREPVSV